MRQVNKLEKWGDVQGVMRAAACLVEMCPDDNVRWVSSAVVGGGSDFRAVG